MFSLHPCSRCYPLPSTGKEVVLCQKTHYISTTKPNQLMLFREISTVYSENHMNYINTVCEQYANIFKVNLHIVMWFIAYAHAWV
jgi:hypothetical protein